MNTGFVIVHTNFHKQTLVMSAAVCTRLAYFWLATSKYMRGGLEAWADLSSMKDLMG